MNQAHHWKQMMNKEYLGSWDLRDGEEIIATIKNVQEKTIIGEGNIKNERPVAYFVENIKPMVLNSTNCLTIENLYKESNPENWKGKKIQIYKSETKVRGELRDCLRLRNYIGYKCAVCGKEVDEKMAKGISAKYGAVYCSEECFKNKDKPKNYL